MTEYSIESGIVAYQQGDKAQAAVIFTALVKQDPNFADAWFWLGRSLADPERARYCFERAASLNPFLSTRSYIYEDPDDKPKSKPVENISIAPPAPPPIPPSIYSPLPAFKPDPLSAPIPPQPVVPPTPPVSPFYAQEPDPISAEPPGQQDGSVTNPQRSDKILVGLIAALISFLALAAPGFLLIRGGALDARLQPELFETRGAETAVLPTATISEPNRGPILRPSATPTPTLSFDAEIDGILEQVYALEGKQEYEKAIEVLNKAIQKYPQYDHFYNLRAYNYAQLTSGLHVQSEYLTYINQAISDQEKANSLPHSEMFFWTYYGNLANYYDDLANQKVFRAEADAYNLISYQNHLLAFENGGDVKTLYGAARDLNELGRWDEAAEIMDEIKQNSSASRGDYADIEAEILRGQKKYKESIELMEQTSSGCDLYYTRSLVQYEAGMKDDAFESINTCITDSPYFGGYRYFLRALIYLDRKEYDLARQDLTTGEGYTWAVHGLHDYVMAKLLLKDGDKENGLYYLQQAEASMPLQMGPILDRVREEMKQLGVDPLTPEPTLESMPTVQPTAGTRLTPRPTTQSTEDPQVESGGLVVNITPSVPSGITELPANHYYFIVVDPNQPMAQKKVPSGSSLDLHFQLPDDLEFSSIDSFSLIFTPRYERQSITLQLDAWVPHDGWTSQPVFWGENTIENPSRLITSDGDFYITILNLNDRSAVMENLQFTIQAKLSDGSTLVMEAQPEADDDNE